MQEDILNAALEGDAAVMDTVGDTFVLDRPQGLDWHPQGSGEVVLFCSGAADLKPPESTHSRLPTIGGPCCLTWPAMHSVLRSMCACP